MHILKSTVGRKILMSITGQLLIIFVLVHLLGNSSIFFGPNGINAYAEHLDDILPLIWTVRILMLAAVVTHIVYGVQVTLENKAAKPDRYAVKTLRKANFASENMIWTGVLIGAFIVYHLFHFTFRLTPDIVQGRDAMGRFDLYTMVVTSFRQAVIALSYAAAMVMLFLHLFHGIPSFMQTMGWNSGESLTTTQKLGRCVSGILLVGYIAIPLSILAGLLKI